MSALTRRIGEFRTAANGRPRPLPYPIAPRLLFGDVNFWIRPFNIGHSRVPAPGAADPCRVNLFLSSYSNMLQLTSAYSNTDLAYRCILAGVGWNGVESDVVEHKMITGLYWPRVTGYDATMRAQRHHSIGKIFVFLPWLFLLPLSASGEIKDQHSVETIVAALKSPIPPQVIQEARSFDDKLMSQGQMEGTKVYLVTDERSSRANALVHKLLEAMGEDTQHWVVRVLDTDPPIANAFVTGGKYIYVYTGLINAVTSDDELAFVLSHELGHSLLKHRLRAKEDVTSTIAGVAMIGALLSRKHRENLTEFAKFTTASYSRGDEEEADAIAVAISRRAGFDPLRGVDFFSRMKRERDKANEEAQRLLAQARQQVEQGQATCQQLTKQYNSSWQYQTPGNANKVNAVCRDAENKRLHYNQAVQQYNLAMQQEQLSSFFSTHPQDQNRIAAVAALTDYVYKRRDLQSLTQYQQSYRVMTALQQVDSVLLKPPAQSVTTSSASGDIAPKRATNTGLSEQLMQLKRAHDQGLITDAEYDKKRQQVLNRY